MQAYERVCESAARAGGRVLLDWLGKIQVTEKAPKDLVTEADVASQRAIQQLIADSFPEHGFLGEEGDPPNGKVSCNQPFRWIVDPLDGTTNYVHQFPGFSVSVALEHEGELIVGAVFDPLTEECFLATKGKGTFLNGEPISVSYCELLNNALVAASFSANVDAESAEIARFLAVLVECQALRRLGSAALNLAYVAAGRLDAYWATSVKTWDVAAGVLLVREAGGIVTGIDGGEFDLSRPTFAAAATDGLHRELLQCLNPES
jgi:myo-inositol-1(or 4)-monophosphatase